MAYRTAVEAAAHFRRLLAGKGNGKARFPVFSVDRLLDPASELPFYLQWSLQGV